MTDDPWRWVRPLGRLRYDFNATLTFVRGVDEAGIVEAFDADLDGWLVADEPNSIRATVDGAAVRLGRSALEVVALSFVLQDGLTTFDYWRGGTWLTSSEIGLPGAGGEDPARFDAAFAAAGMTTEFASLDVRVVQVLTALGREVGISLPFDELDGPAADLHVPAPAAVLTARVTLQRAFAHAPRHRHGVQ